MAITRRHAGSAVGDGRTGGSRADEGKAGRGGDGVSSGGGAGREDFRPLKMAQAVLVCPLALALARRNVPPADLDLRHRRPNIRQNMRFPTGRP
jgi:hypothetical protein